jgi:hypothetical protein
MFFSNDPVEDILKTSASLMTPEYGKLIPEIDAVYLIMFARLSAKRQMLPSN